ncbi:MAG: hypothetical protein ACYTXE_43980, partial [Nostoc sp.]
MASNDLGFVTNSHIFNPLSNELPLGFGCVSWAVTCVGGGAGSRAGCCVSVAGAEVVGCGLVWAWMPK